jgi:hypothetical protein
VYGVLGRPAETRSASSVVKHGAAVTATFAALHALWAAIAIERMKALATAGGRQDTGRYRQG